MQTITLIDTSLATDNLGDEIIMDAVERAVFALFPEAYYYRVPSHELLSYRTRRFVAKSDYCFIGGTNLLSARLNGRSQWRVRWFDTLWMNRAICLGVGWEGYSKAEAGLDTRLRLRALLDGKALHSVRDTHTKDLATKAGVRCINTACPTMWELTQAHCRSIPRRKAEDVVFTLTEWRADPAADGALIEALKRHYRRVHFFTQMRGDYDYLQRFDVSGVHVITPTTKGYTRFLENEAVDYVGTRLHGGIRALQKAKRTLILGVDNRGTEIHRDTNLPVLPRTDLAAISAWIEGESTLDLHLPWSAIATWQAQFGIAAPAANADAASPHAARHRI